MPDIVKVVVFSIVAYVYLFIIAKLLGKKQISQLTFIDYVVGITIGSIAAEMATETVDPFYHYLIAMAIFFVFDLLVSLIARKSATLKKVMNGRPIVIINNGEFDYDGLKKSKLSVDEIAGLARDKGFFDLDQIAFAVFETSGKLSVLPKSANQPVTCQDMNLNPPPSSLIEYLVIDGSVCRDTLKESGMSEQWLYDGLKVSSKEELDKILAAYYDSQKQEFIIKYKMTPEQTDEKSPE